jgi:hypothetical protein
MKNSRHSQYLLVFLFIFVFPIDAVFCGEAHGLNTLGFFRIVDEKTTYDLQPQKFEILRFKTRSSAYERYVERQSSLVIKTADVRSITVEKTKVYGGERGVEDIVKDTLGPQSDKKGEDRDFPFGYIYKATFYLSEKAGQLFSQFARRHEQQPFDFRLGKHRLAVIQFIGGFEGSYEFTTFLEEKNPDRISEIFGPIKDKVIWK